MNQARSTYQTDFTPFDWLQNNVNTDTNEFCSSENIDECLKYISQEFSALGFPSIYSCSNDRPSHVNCDIVKFLNVTYHLLRRNNEFIEKNEDLESRNQQLNTDLIFLNKKNSVLKSNVEQTERKLSSVLERERQLKEKNGQLLQQLKAEKEETKKLLGQLRQQKVTYQHEIRKYENNMNHIKAKINQLLSDKNPNKKIATMTSSHTLPRNSGQRGKWKTGVAATTAVEEMYNTVIASYESRSKELFTDLNSLRQCLQSVSSEIVNIVSILQSEIDNTAPTRVEEIALNKMECQDISSIGSNLRFLLNILKESALQKIYEIKKDSQVQVTDLKVEHSEYKTPENNSDSQKFSTEEAIKLEKVQIEAEKLALSKSFEDIEKEKAEIAVQKVALLRLAIQQKIPSSSWHESANTFPSISVITSGDGSRSISNLNYLKCSFSTPEQLGQSDRSFSPQWMSDDFVNNAAFCRKSDCMLSNKSLSACQSSAGSPLPTDVKFSNSDLPSWAADKMESPSSCINDSESTTLEISHNVSSNEDLLNESSNEELSLLKLKAAVEDIEKKRTVP